MTTTSDHVPLAGQLAVEAAHERWRSEWGQMRLTIDLLARCANVSKQHMARELGVSRQAVYTWLSGERVPEPWYAEGIAAVLEVPRGWLDKPPREAALLYLDPPYSGTGGGGTEAPDQRSALHNGSYVPAPAHSHLAA